MDVQLKSDQRAGARPVLPEDGAEGISAPIQAARRVLVVDDSRLQRRILLSSLSGWGYELREADSGEAALAVCSDWPPDLVISDWMMPGMDGLSFCKQFRTLERESYGYFLLLTSKNEKVHAAEGLDAGADDFLTKPVNKAELRARLNAGERILDMQEELTAKNRIIRQTLSRLQAAHDVIDRDLIEGAQAAAEPGARPAPRLRAGADLAAAAPRRARRRRPGGVLPDRRADLRLFRHRRVGPRDQLGPDDGAAGGLPVLGRA